MLCSLAQEFFHSAQETMNLRENIASFSISNTSERGKRDFELTYNVLGQTMVLKENQFLVEFIFFRMYIPWVFFLV